MKKDEVIAHLKEIIIDRLDVEESQRITLERRVCLL